jgi:NAD(P)H dehydrogenase (quinone)
MPKLFLVYGASGAQRGAVARALLARGDRVRLLLRRAERKRFEGHAAVEIAVGDFADRPSLAAASQGADGVSLAMPLVYNLAQVVQWGCNAIDAAQEAGVPLLVFNTNSVVAAQPTGMVAIDIKVELEAYLARAALPSIVLRPTVYNGNLAAPWSAPAIVHQGVLACPIPADHRVSWISWEELAAYTVAALDSRALAARKPVFRVGGRHAPTGPELASQLSEVIGKPLSYLPVPLDQFEAGLNASFGASVGTEVARFYRWMNDPANGYPLDVDLTPARAALPVPQQTFADWARSVPWTQLAGNGQ